MHKAKRAWQSAVLAVAIAGCGGERHGSDNSDSSAPPTNFIQGFTGEPYLGPVKVTISPPNGKAWSQWGNGSARFVDKGDGNAQLVVFGAIDNEKGDAGFAIDGQYDQTGWERRSDNIRLGMKPGGKITGKGTIYPQKLRFSGTASISEFKLDVDIELLEATKHALPRGTLFRFSYDLSRKDRDVETKTATADMKSGGEEKCEEIRYEMRPVANIGDGTMSMIQVPICLD